MQSIRAILIAVVKKIGQTSKNVHGGEFRLVKSHYNVLLETFGRTVTLKIPMKKNM